MPDVLIDFKVDYSQLDSAIDTLAKTGQVDAKVAQSFKATTAAVNQQAAAVKGVANAYKGPITSLDQLDKRSKKFVDDFIKGFEEGVKSELISAKKEIDALKSKFEAAGKTSTNSTNTLKKELKALTAAIAEAKATGGPVDQKMLQRAGQLKDAIADANAEIKNAGSDTRGLDNLLGTAQAVAGGFAIVQGSAALFGDESEELQKTLLKVNAAMSVLQGLQSIQNALQKEGAITKALQNAQQSIAVVQTNLETAAQSKNVVVKNLATAAQWALNVAMNANPIGIIITALVAVTAALVIFTRNTREAAAEQERLNGAISSSTEALDAQLEGIRDANERIIIGMEKQKAKDSEITQQRINNLKLVLAEEVRTINDINAALAKGDGNQEERMKLVERRSELEKNIRAQKLDGLRLENQLEKDLAAEQQKRDDEQKKRQQDELERARKRLTDMIDLLKAERLQVDENTETYGQLTLQINRLQTAYDNIEASMAKQTLNWVQNKVAAKDAISTIENAITGGFQNALNSVGKDVEKVKAPIASLGTALTTTVSGALDTTKQSFTEFLNEVIPAIQTGLNALNGISQGLNSISQERQNNQKIELDNQRAIVDDLLEAGAITEKDAEQRQRRLDRQERVQRTKAAQQAKQLAIFQAVISTAQAVVNALATPPAPVGIALAAVVGALGAAQIAAIAARPIPKFATGKKSNWSGIGTWGEAGTEMKVNKHGEIEFASKATTSYIAPTDKIYTAAETKRILPYVDKLAMKGVQVDKQPSMLDIVKAMPKQQPSAVVNIDKEFIKEAVADGLAMTNYRDRRYGTK